MSGTGFPSGSGLDDPAAFPERKQEGIDDTRQVPAEPTDTQMLGRILKRSEAFTRDRSPGSDWHLTMLMAPLHLNLVVGPDRDALLAFGRAVWAAAVQDHVSQRRGT
jgi:hypothetical protein